MNENRNNFKRKFNGTLSKRKFLKWNRNQFAGKKYVYKSPTDHTMVQMSTCIDDTEDHLFDVQLMQFLTKIEMPITEVNNKINHIVVALQSVLKDANIMYKEIRPFGSSVTGLSLKDSDIDVFIQCQNPRMEALKRIKNRLYRNSDFRNVILIDAARVPIIKCRHVPTNTECDLSIFSHLGCENTSLTKDYFKFDGCLRSVLLFLKHWLKVFTLHGMGKINTYALTWLVIFFLMQNNDRLKNKRLPTVRRLQELAGNRTIIVKSWNCAYTFLGLKHVKPSASGIYAILLEFFLFYRNFDYANYVMSPYTGTAIPLNDFADDCDRLPECFARYKDLVGSRKVRPFGMNHCIYLQDPFEHNLNIVKQASETVIKKFRDSCAIATDILRQNGASFTAVNKLLTFDVEPSPPVYFHKPILIKEKHFPKLFNVDKDGIGKIFAALRYVLQKVFLCRVTAYNHYYYYCDNRKTMTLNVEAVNNIISERTENSNNSNNHHRIIDNNNEESLNYEKRIIINCCTVYDVTTRRGQHKLKRKQLKPMHNIDFEEQKSLQSVVLLEREIQIKIEFQLQAEQTKFIRLIVDGPTNFTEFFRANCVIFIGHALHKLYNLNAASLAEKTATPAVDSPTIHVISDEDDDSDNNTDNPVNKVNKDIVVIHDEVVTVE